MPKLPWKSYTATHATCIAEAVIRDVELFVDAKTVYSARTGFSEVVGYVANAAFKNAHGARQQWNLSEHSSMDEAKVACENWWFNWQTTLVATEEGRNAVTRNIAKLRGQLDRIEQMSLNELVLLHAQSAESTERLAESLIADLRRELEALGSAINTIFESIQS